MKLYETVSIGCDETSEMRNARARSAPCWRRSASGPTFILSVGSRRHLTFSPDHVRRTTIPCCVATVWGTPKRISRSCSKCWLLTRVTMRARPGIASRSISRPRRFPSTWKMPVEPLSISPVEEDERPGGRRSFMPVTTRTSGQPATRLRDLPRMWRTTQAFSSRLDSSTTECLATPRHTTMCLRFGSAWRAPRVRIASTHTARVCFGSMRRRAADDGAVLAPFRSPCGSPPCPPLISGETRGGF